MDPRSHVTSFQPVVQSVDSARVAGKLGLS